VIRRVRDGKVYLSQTMTDHVLKCAVGSGSPGLEGPSVDCLSNRELEVFRLLGQGLDAAQIAAKMFVSPKTVETYQARIKEKLNLSSGRELLQRAAQWVSAES
jgi:DNA-binding NarL/FixJ family response regulator